MADFTDQSSNVVFNSLLCYVITKLRTLETARIRSTVLDFYSADDVSSAKNVLMEAVSYVQLDKPLSRYPERQSNDRTVREMDDVMDTSTFCYNNGKKLWLIKSGDNLPGSVMCNE